MVDDQAGGGVKEYSSYELDANGLHVKIRIIDKGDFTPVYEVTTPGIGDATKVLMISLRQSLMSMVPIDPMRIEDKEYVDELTKKYEDASEIVIERYLPGSSEETKKVLIAYIINFMLGLGDLQAPLADDNLEEIAVNNSKEPVWVYHKKYGWCKTNVTILDESIIYDDSEQIGRRIGRAISNLDPLMDAELSDGSRVNATLYPVSQKGNTITIRKFGKNPWTMTAMLANGTVSNEMASLIWLCVENEVSLLISGGTASGKTSFLNAMSIFMPANHRIISVEETRELTLPSFLHWVPMLTRQPNPEGKGEVTLYDLMINALRQRPDIVLVGEVRTKKDAETLFEAIHTGHAVYGTVHADNAQDTVIRMTNPPIEVPKLMINAFGGIVTLFRHRRLGIRRVLEFGELTKTGDVNVIYRWDMRSDVFNQISELARLSEMIALYGGLNREELLEGIREKGKVLAWMVKNNILDVDAAGFVISNYYKNRDAIMRIVNEDTPYSHELIEKV
ncbi:putative KH and PIN-domain containing protein [uncultured archaeon]|nr:putative KH and PIN-domain containing protein [uncultured archaeon]